MAAFYSCGICALGFMMLIASTMSAPMTNMSASSQLPLVAYLDNTAFYRTSPYAREVSDLGRVVSSLNALIYGQLEIDDAYGVQSRMVNDDTYYTQVNDLRAYNSDLKVLFSVGGPTVPSHTWSAMAANSDYRQAFITSVKGLMTDFGFDGLELDWVSPCSAKKVIYIDVSGGNYAEVVDEGGSCPDDKENYQELLKELRDSLGETTTIVVAVRQDESVYSGWIGDIEPYADNFMLKAYGYAVPSDPNTGGSSVTAAFQPIASSSHSQTTASASVQATIAQYIQDGMVTSKIVVVVPSYGTTYYIPNAGSNWQSLGVAASKPGACSGPYESTYGGSVSDATGECGIMTYQEILQELASDESSQAVQDRVTLADLGYFPSKTILTTFTGVTGIRSLVGVVQSNRIGGMAIDSIDKDAIGSIDYQLTMTLCKEFLGDSDRCIVRGTTTQAPGPTPPPGSGCSGLNQGQYCVNSSAFIVCPNSVVIPCSVGTECKQTGSTTVECNWPQNDKISIS